MSSKQQDGFIENKSHQTNRITFFNRIDNISEEIVTNIISLSFSSTSDTCLENELVLAGFKEKQTKTQQPTK